MKKQTQLYDKDHSTNYINDYETIVIKPEDIESISNVKNGVKIKFINNNPFVMSDSSIVLEDCVFEDMKIKFFK